MPPLTDACDTWLEQCEGHAMTTERYGVALRRTAHYLLQLPKDILAKIIDGPDNDNVLKNPIILLICEVLPIFFTRSPRTTDLYFLVALTYPVMGRLSSRWVTTYLHEVGILFLSCLRTI